MECDPDNDDLIRFPEGFPDVGLMTFATVFQSKKEWVSFTVIDMTNPTGFFKTWKNYCMRKSKQDNGTGS